MNIMNRAKARVGQIKADRSTEMGVAGHHAAMKALGSSMGYTEPMVPSNVSVLEPDVVDRHKPTEDF